MLPLLLLGGLGLVLLASGSGGKSSGGSPPPPPLPPLPPQGGIVPPGTVYGEPVDEAGQPYGPRLEQEAPPEVVAHYAAILADPTGYTLGEIRAFTTIVASRGYSYEGDQLATAAEEVYQQTCAGPPRNAEHAAFQAQWCVAAPGRFGGGQVPPFPVGRPPAPPPPPSEPTATPPPSQDSGSSQADDPQADLYARMMAGDQEAADQFFQQQTAEAEARAEDAYRRASQEGYRKAMAAKEQAEAEARVLERARLRDYAAAQARMSQRAGEASLRAGATVTAAQAEQQAKADMDQLGSDLQQIYNRPVTTGPSSTEASPGLSGADVRAVQDTWAVTEAFGQPGFILTKNDQPVGFREPSGFIKPFPSRKAAVDFGRSQGAPW